MDTLLQVSLIWIVVGLGLIWLVVLLGLPYLSYYFVSLPLRRRERARMFLDLVETGIKSGSSPERTIVGASLSGDRTLAARFHLLAAHLESGLRLDAALDRVPRLLPPQITAMLKAGMTIGDLPRVLPACRMTLRDAASQMQGAMNYLLIMIFVVLPAVPAILIWMQVYIMPQMWAVMEDMAPRHIPDITRAAFDWCPVLAMIQFGFCAVLLFFTLCYVGGPRLRFLGGQSVASILDRIVLWLPWRRQRLQRDFATMLALLLDAVIPEPVAVTLAAESTANRVLMRRSEQVVAQLNAGVKLTEAIHLMDRSGEFRWRLSNAAHARKGFIAALTGWLEALDVRAFQQEQVAAQGITTAWVLMNGLVTGLLAFGFFAFLINLLETALLW